MQEQLEHTQHTVASLQALLTTPTAPKPISYRTLAATPALVVRAMVAFDAATDWLGDAYSELHRALDAAGVSPAGPDGGLSTTSSSPRATAT